MKMAYRDLSTGGQDRNGFYLYAYSFILNQLKMVGDLALPNNGNVAVLAITLTGPSPRGGRATNRLAWGAFADIGWPSRPAVGSGKGNSHGSR